LERGGTPAVGLLSITAAAAWPASAGAAEALNLFPDPLHVLVNVAVFLLLIYPVSRFLLRPLVRTLEERERRTEGALSRVDSLLAEATQRRESVENRLEAAREEAQGGRGEILQRAEEEESQKLGQAREEAARILEQAREAIAGDVEAARESLRADADALAQELASKVLGRPL
jgi:F-type H+-transporting ATPase subunit b